MIFYVYMLKSVNNKITKSYVGYTNNLKLTIFLAERAVLLYTEFIIMSKEAEELDPVCGMEVAPNKAVDSFEFDGRIFYFCCSGCKDKFALRPLSYIS